MDRIGMEIKPGDFILLMRKGTGWDVKNTYFSVQAVWKVTEKMVFYGNPELKLKTKQSNVIVLTKEQFETFCDTQMEDYKNPQEHKEECIKLHKSILRI